jgi:hypothetical protein
MEGLFDGKRKVPLKRRVGIVSDLKRDHWYRVTFFTSGEEREAVGKYLGLSTWKNLPEHKHGESTPRGGGDVEYHWFSIRDQSWPLSIRPDDLIGVFEIVEPASQSRMFRRNPRLPASWQ